MNMNMNISKISRFLDFSIYACMCMNVMNECNVMNLIAFFFSPLIV